MKIEIKIFVQMMNVYIVYILHELLFIRLKLFYLR